MLYASYSAALVVQQRIGPRPAIAIDAGGQHQVVVAAGDVQRIELQRPEALDDRPHRIGLWREAAWRRQEVARDEESARGRTVDGAGIGHPPMVPIQISVISDIVSEHPIVRRT